MSYELAMPGKYVQGAGVLHDIGDHSSAFGDRALLIGGPTALSVSRAAIVASLQGAGGEVAVGHFQGECTANEIDRLTRIARDATANIVIGVGGGKALDAAKAVAHYLGAPMVSVPTIASTDGPVSGVVGMYSEDHTPLETGIELRRSPNVVLVDSEVILRSPLRFTISGIGDALSTNVEAEACAKAGAPNVHGASATASAITCARLCDQIVMDYGLEAKRSVEQGVLSEAFEKVLEASILLSGMGFENCGLSIAHALWLSFGKWRAFRRLDVHHGEAVALFTLVQIVVEGRPRAVIDEVVELCTALGLPVSLTDIGIPNAAREELLEEAIEPAFFPGSTIHHVPFSVDPNMIYEGFQELEELVDHRG